MVLHISDVDLEFLYNMYINDFCFSGAQGEYAGLRAIMAYLNAIGEKQRTVSLVLE